MFRAKRWHYMPPKSSVLGQAGSGSSETAFRLVGTGLARGTNRTAAYAACWVGSMVTVKRVDLMLSALSQLPDVHLTLIGDGPLRAELEEIAGRLGIADRCRFLGHRSDVPAQLANHDVFVLSSAAENCPLALLEAMAAGCAVVASAVGGVPEIIRHGVDGLLFEPGSATALAAN